MIERRMSKTPRAPLKLNIYRAEIKNFTRLFKRLFLDLFAEDKCSLKDLNVVESIKK